MLATPISRAYNAVVRGSATAAFVKGCLCNTGLGLPYHSGLVTDTCPMQASASHERLARHAKAQHTKLKSRTLALQAVEVVGSLHTCSCNVPHMSSQPHLRVIASDMPL